MPSIAFEALFIILLIIANGVFSMSELAIVSARKVRLEQWAKEGNAKARAALRLISSPNNFLSTTQIGITLIGILSGALGGTTVAKTLKDSLDTIPLIKPYSETLSFSIVVGIITVQKHLWTDRAAFVLLQIIKTMGDPLAYRCDA